MTLYWHNTGPLLTYTKNRLDIYDLNPEWRVTWRISRLEMFKIGWRCMLAALCERHEIQLPGFDDGGGDATKAEAP